MSKTILQQVAEDNPHLTAAEIQYGCVRSYNYKQPSYSCMSLKSGCIECWNRPAATNKITPTLTIEIPYDTPEEVEEVKARLEKQAAALFMDLPQYLKFILQDFRKYARNEKGENQCQTQE